LVREQMDCERRQARKPAQKERLSAGYAAAIMPSMAEALQLCADWHTVAHNQILCRPTGA